MRAYAAFFRLRFIAGLQYRSAALGGIVTQYVWGFMTILMFRAFYQSNPAAFPMEFAQLSSYIWMQQSFLTMFATWFLDNDIFASITSGDLAYELVRPLDLYWMWFTKNMAIRLSRMLLRSVPILLVAFLLPAPYGLTLPNPTQFLFFLLTMVLAFLVVIAVCMLIYIVTCYTLSAAATRTIAVSVIDFLSGQIIPLTFFPMNIQTILKFTPFAAMQHVPFHVYNGVLYGQELVQAVLLQITWLAFLVALGIGWMHVVLKRVAVQGG